MAEETYIYDQDGVRRMKDIDLVLPVCVGSVAFPLGKKAVGDFTHSWTVYVRSPTNADITPFIKQVNFHLHSSFAQPVRALTNPPFEVTEQGWGEFEIKAEIFFHDDARVHPNSMVLTHYLKLYEEGSALNHHQQQQTGKTVVRELYDEVVFWEPPEAFYRRVKAMSMQPQRTIQTTATGYLPVHDEEAELAKINAAREKIAMQNHHYKKQLGI